MQAIRPRCLREPLCERTVPSRLASPRAACAAIGPGGGKVKVPSYATPEDAEALAALAERRDRSVSWLVADAIRQYLARAP